MNDLLPSPDPPEAVLVPGALAHDQSEGHIVCAPDLPTRWELKELKPMHRQVAALVAQGMKYKEVAALINITPQYVTALMAQPLVKEYVASLCGVAEARMEALFPKAVDTIAEIMDKGTEKGKLAAVKLQLDATKRLGSTRRLASETEDADARLERLAERLIGLQSKARSGLVQPGEEIIDV